MENQNLISDDGTVYHFNKTENGMELFTTDSEGNETPMCSNGLLFSNEDMAQVAMFILDSLPEELILAMMASILNTEDK